MNKSSENSTIFTSLNLMVFSNIVDRLMSTISLFSNFDQICNQLVYDNEIYGVKW